MEILDEFSQEGLETTVKVLKNNGVAVVPTDTVYGLVCNALSEEAVGKIFEIKRRPIDKALPIFVRDLEMAREYAEIPSNFIPFLERVWPGKVTVVFNITEKQKYLKTKRFPSVLTGGGGTVGIRVTDTPFIFRVFDEINFPLAQTSANVSGQGGARMADDVLRSFQNGSLRPDLVIEGGECSGLPSTVVEFFGGEAKILRKGAVSEEELKNLFRETGLG